MATCGDSFCDGNDETCRSCELDCGPCAPCDIAPSCDAAMIAPGTLPVEPSLNVTGLQLRSRADVRAELAEKVSSAPAGMRLLAAALEPTAEPGEHPAVARLRQSLAQFPEQTKKIREELKRAGLISPSDYRHRFPLSAVVPDLDTPMKPMGNEFPGGSMECGSPELRVGIWKVHVIDSQDGFMGGNADEIYCLVEGEAQTGSEIRVTPLLPSIHEGDTLPLSNEAGVFWGTTGPKTPGSDLLITYNCVESDDSANYQNLLNSIGTGAGQVGQVYDGSYGWVFSAVGGAANIASAAMATNGDDAIFNTQQLIPLSIQLQLTNGAQWSVQQSDSDWNWELIVRAWGCAQYGLL